VYEPDGKKLVPFSLRLVQVCKASGPLVILNVRCIKLQPKNILYEEYGESWETAALYFKNAITKEKWEQTLTAVRKPLGQLVSRDLSSKTYMSSIPGAPDGEYVVIQFKTSFENKKSGIETVTPMLDKDGKWRVSGYYIK